MYCHLFNFKIFQKQKFVSRIKLVMETFEDKANKYCMQSMPWNLHTFAWCLQLLCKLLVLIVYTSGAWHINIIVPLESVSNWNDILNSLSIGFSDIVTLGKNHCSASENCFLCSLFHIHWLQFFFFVIPKKPSARVLIPSLYFDTEL